MNIILTGFMGTGKTAVGKRLAKRLGWRFVDIDQLIEAQAKMPVARIFAERGEAVFRRLEQRCIGRVVHSDQQVVATGGGAFVDPKNRAWLRASGVVVCLTATPRVILTRVGKRLDARPLLGNPSTRATARGRGLAQGSAPAAWLRQAKPLGLHGGDPLERIQALLAQRARAYAKADVTIDTSLRSADVIVEQLWAQLGPPLCRSWQYLLTQTGKLAHRYGGKYVVVVGNRVVSSGDTQLAAYQHACLPRQRPLAGRRQARLNESAEAGIYYIPLPEESLTAL